VSLRAAVQKSGVASRYPGDLGIADDPSVIFADGFENGLNAWTTFRNRDAISILQDSGMSHAGSATVRITATRGHDTGGALGYRWPDGVDRLHVRFYCKFHPDTVKPHHFVNMGADSPLWNPGGHAGERREGHLTYSTTIEPPRTDDKDPGWYFYTYWHQMRSWENPDGTTKHPPKGNGRSFYGNNFKPDSQGLPFERDRWICVEFMMQANTPRQSDGVQGFWIDGVPVGRYGPGKPLGSWIRDRFVTSGPFNTNPQPFEGMNWRSIPELKLNRVGLQWYISDEVAEPGPSDHNTVYFDDVVFATEYIGPLHPVPDH